MIYLENCALTGTTALVALDKAEYSFDKLYEYAVPSVYVPFAAIGCRVTVPFGRGKRYVKGTIIELTANKEYDPNVIKRIRFLLDREPPINDELVKLARYLKTDTFCTYGDAIRTVMPPGLNLPTARYVISNKKSLPLSERARNILNELHARKDFRSRDELLDELSFTEADTWGELLEVGAVRLPPPPATVEGVKRRKAYRITDKAIDSALTEKQTAVIAALSDNCGATQAELCLLAECSAGVIQLMVKHGLLDEIEISSPLSFSDKKTATKPLPILNEQQQAVFARLTELLDTGKANGALLHGVTGSGKTAVYVRLIAEAMSKGKTALLLVPEIALTPQTLETFSEIFGDTAAVIHSGLTLGERAAEYRRLKDGAAKIAIGTRSAVFAPIKNIGVIIIDEEGEQTYTSDRSPRYNARETAKQRAFYHNALIVLGSATPSLESFYLAKTGKYELLTLTKRYKEATLPDVYIVDMREELKRGNRSGFSEPLLHDIKHTLERGEQVIILKNRRGYNTKAFCSECGAVINCPLCQLALTYHKQINRLCCHYCGYTEAYPTACPTCKGEMSRSGSGTQRVEGDLADFFPQAKILRMDSDSVNGRESYEEKFAAFKNREYDILIGTQMIAKGLDFENVTLVGVTEPDAALFSGDYLGFERVFSLLTQVIGRCGRGGKKGRAYIQTYTPQHHILIQAARQDYAAFYDGEIRIRTSLLFPPAVDFIVFTFAAYDETTAHKAAERFIAIFQEEAAGFKAEALGPAPSGNGSVGGKYRRKVILRCKNNRAFRSRVENMIKRMYKENDIFGETSFYADVNGSL